MKAMAIFLLAALPVLACGGLWFLAQRSAQVEPELGLVDGRLRPVSAKPNAVCSEAGTPEDARVEPLRFQGSGEAALRALGTLVESGERAEVVTSQAGYLHVVFRTALFGFHDDFEARLDPEASVLHVRSASRVGHSDLGANRRRIETLRERWKQTGERVGTF